MEGGVTLECASDYGRRCESIGAGRRNTADLQDAMNNPRFKQAHHQLLDELVAEYRQSRPIIERSVWKTVTVGNLPKDAKSRRKILTDVGIRISDWGGDILDRIQPAKPTEIELVLVTVSELGFPDRATVSQIYAALPSFDLEPCPAEVGPRLRLAYTDQPLDEWIMVGMEPIADSGGGLRVFSVERGDDGLWLCSRYAGPAYRYSGVSRWVFGRKSPSTS